MCTAASNSQHHQCNHKVNHHRSGLYILPYSTCLLRPCIAPRDVSVASQDNNVLYIASILLTPRPPSSPALASLPISATSPACSSNTEMGCIELAPYPSPPFPPLAPPPLPSPPWPASPLLGSAISSMQCHGCMQVIQEAQKWCHSVSGGTELPALLSLADAALTQFIAALQVKFFPHFSSSAIFSEAECVTAACLCVQRLCSRRCALQQGPEQLRKQAAYTFVVYKKGYVLLRYTNNVYLF